MIPTTHIFGIFQQLGPLEIFVIVFVILLLFGAKKLPELARGMGKAMREFKKATREVEQDIRSAMEEEPAETQKKGSQPPSKTPPNSMNSDN